MRFLAPLYLAGSALVILPIILHLLRRDVAGRVPFSAVRLLRTTPLDRSRNRRLRDILLLIARAAALLLLAASFARPFRPGAADQRRLTIVAVDRSFSMGAPGIFQRASALARTEIDAAGNDVAVIAFDDRADVVAVPGLAADARTALAGVTPGFGGTRYAALFERATALAGGEPARLVVISDLQRSGFDDAGASLPEGIDLEVRDAGAARPNLAIDSLDVRDGRSRVAVHNYGPDGADTTLRLEQTGKPATTRRLHLGPQAAMTVLLDAPSAGATKASIDDPNGYAADNSRFALAQSAARPRVLVVSGVPGSRDGFYFTRALQASGAEGADVDVRSVTGTDLSRASATETAGASAVVLLSTHGMQRRAAEAFERLFAAGGGVFVAAGPDVDPAMLSELLGLRPALTADEDATSSVLTVSDVRHPIFRTFDAVTANLAHVSFDREWRLGILPHWRTLASFSTGRPALVEHTIGNGRVLLFASDVDRRWNDFPLHATFVPFVQEAVRYVGARRIEDEDLRVSDLPDGVAASPGIAAVRGRLRAVNVDARESTVARLTPAEFARAVRRTRGAQPPAGDRRVRDREALQGLWRWGLGLMLATLIVEAFVASR